MFVTQKQRSHHFLANRRVFETKKLLIVPGAGHVVFGSAGEGYLNQVEEFIPGVRSVSVEVKER